MSKRHGKMYMALRLVKEAAMNIGLNVRMDHDQIAGYAPIYWTKTAARERFGRKVELMEISIAYETRRT